MGYLVLALAGLALCALLALGLVLLRPCWTIKIHVGRWPTKV